MICWFFRIMISNASDSDRGLPVIVKRHIRRCSACCEFHRTCMTLGWELPAQAVVAKAHMADHLGPRMAAGEPAVKRYVPRPRFGSRRLAAVAAIALISAVAALIVFGPHFINGSPPVAQQPVAMGIQDVPIPWSVALRNPLQTELNSLTNDTQSAVRFLVACVAVDPVARTRYVEPY